jgi:hypothetical protein
MSKRNYEIFKKLRKYDETIGTNICLLFNFIVGPDLQFSRLIFRLKFFNHMTTHRIAEISGLSLKAVNNHIGLVVRQARKNRPEIKHIIEALDLSELSRIL